MWTYLMFMGVHIVFVHVQPGAGIRHICQSLFLRQGFSGDLEFTDFWVAMTSSLSWGPCLCFLSAGIRGGCHTCLAFVGSGESEFCSSHLPSVLFTELPTPSPYSLALLDFKHITTVPAHAFALTLTVRFARLSLPPSLISFRPSCKCHLSKENHMHAQL